MTLFWINYNAAVINGWWWWWLPPIVVIGLLFISLFLTSVGLDEIANPRIQEVGRNGHTNLPASDQSHDSEQRGQRRNEHSKPMFCAWKT